MDNAATARQPRSRPGQPAAGESSVRPHTNFIWSIAESLRGPFKPAEYGSVEIRFQTTSGQE